MRETETRRFEPGMTEYHRSNGCFRQQWSRNFGKGTSKPMFLFRRTFSCIASDRCLVPVSTHVHNVADLKTIIIQDLYCRASETVRCEMS